MNIVTKSTRELRERLTAQLAREGIDDARVLDVMADIPREEFLPRAFAAKAYENEALPIGENQTISQPLVVALMTQGLELKNTHKVLEIGTGSGYQTAVLCKLARRVYTIERFKSLSETAADLLHNLGYHNFVSKTGDGTLGWPEQGPFDRIIVTAAAPKVPQSLLDQLAVHGVLVIPVGPQSGLQKLMRYGKRKDGSIVEDFLCDVSFVPLVGREGVPEARKAS